MAIAFHRCFSISRVLTSGVGRARREWPSLRLASLLPRLTGEEFPTMRQLAAPLAQPPSDEHFLTGLRWLLDGITQGDERDDAD